MKTLMLTLAIFVLHQKYSYGRSFIVIEKGEHGITPKLRQLPALKRKHMDLIVPSEHHPTLTSERDFPNLYEARRNNDENLKVERLLQYVLQKDADDLREKIECDEAYVNKEFKDPSNLPIDLDDRKRAFPQSFESLFIENTLENEIGKKEMDRKQADDDLQKIAEDLRQLDLFDAEKRSNHKIKKEVRPPKPG